jgi:SPP1 gp7 family putative phage head morphogenesis protein
MQNRKNEAYWKAREQAEKKWIAQNLKNDKEFNGKLAEYYERAIDDICDKIDVEYQKIAEVHGDGIDITGAYRPVNKLDIERYEREAKELVVKANRLRKKDKKASRKDFTAEENARMKVYNATMRLNRLEYLKSQIGLTMADLGMDIDDEMREKIQDDYMDEIKRQSGILGKDLTKTSLWASSTVATIVMAQTGAVNFSQRIWANIDALKAELDAVISTGIIHGDNPREIARLLKKHVKQTVTNHRYVAERLARTESARVQHKAQVSSLIKADYRFCRWHAEPGACKICSDIANNDDGFGKGVYEIDDCPIVPGHPNCRCGIGAYWVDGKNNSYIARKQKTNDKE